MREILFKAKRKDNGEWVEGGYFSEPYTDKKYIVRWNSFGLGFNEFIEVAPDTICQYTGRTDKNDRKIWENDIAKHESSQGIGIVKWYQGDYIGWCVDDAYYNGEQQFTKEMWDECEIAGNIFDNPELLEVEE